MNLAPVLRFPTSSKQYVRIVGSCNGLVCLNVFNRGNECIYFWNPSTKQSIKLPYTFAVRDCNIFGFGFDDSNNEFKLVRIFLESSCELTRFSVEIYGMWESSRRRIAFFPYGFPYTRTEAIFFNGAMHKVAVRGQKSVVNGVTITRRNWFIVALDIVNETFREVPQPQFEDAAFRCTEKNMTLYSVGDLLCVVRSYRESHGDVWIMKEYGVKESWVKLVRIRIPFVSVPSPALCKLRPVYFSEKHGELLIVIRDQLVLYCSKENEFRHLRLSGVNLKSKFFIQFKTHVDSLFTPSVMMKLRGEPSHKDPEN